MAYRATYRNVSQVTPRGAGRPLNDSQTCVPSDTFPWRSLLIRFRPLNDSQTCVPSDTVLIRADAGVGLLSTIVRHVSPVTPAVTAATASARISLNDSQTCVPSDTRGFWLYCLVHGTLNDSQTCVPSDTRGRCRAASAASQR